MAEVTVTVPDVAEPKAGMLTTEHFWTVVAAAVAQVEGFTGVLPEATAAKVTAALVGVYTMARAAVKIAHAFGYAKNLPDAPTLPSTTEVSK